MTTSVIAMAAAVATTSVTAHAQAQVEEVVVTARKREESLQDVPVAVTALSGGELANKGVQSPRELATTVPGLAVGLSAASATAVVFSIRGQTASDVLLTIDQAVGVYVDGINVPRPTGLDAGFVDLQRVEVVKGPQGTLYGRNTTGGAVNVITRAPDFDGVHGFLTGELGNHKDLKASGAINLPIIDDTLATRLVFQRWQREGFGHSAGTGQDLGRDHDQTYFRASINYRPTSALLLELKGDWYRARENGTLSTLRKYVGSVATDTQAAFDLGFPNTVAGRAAARQFIIDNYERTGNADFFHELFSGAITGRHRFSLADGDRDHRPLRQRDPQVVVRIPPILVVARGGQGCDADQGLRGGRRRAWAILPAGTTQPSSRILFPRGQPFRCGP